MRGFTLKEGGAIVKERRLKEIEEKWGVKAVFRVPNPQVELEWLLKVCVKNGDRLKKFEVKVVEGLKVGKVGYIIFKDCVFPLIQENEKVPRLIDERDDLKRFFRRKSVISSLRQKMRDEIMVHRHFPCDEIFG